MDQTTTNEARVDSVNAIKDVLDKSQDSLITDESGATIVDPNADVTLTEEQEKLIYDRLDGVDETPKVEEDYEEEENPELEEVELDPNDPGINISEIEPTQEDVKATLANYGLDDDAALKLYKTINEYRNGVKKDYYSELPQTFQNIANGLRKFSLQQGHPISKNDAAMLVLKDMLEDAQLERAMNDIQREQDQLIAEMSTEYGKIFNDTYEEIFNSIDEIEAKDPEEAEKIRKVKQAFDDANSMERLKEFVKTTNINKLRKKADNRFDDEVYYFNKKVNVTDVKIPDVGALVDVIHRWLPERSITAIKRLVIAIALHIDEIDVDKDVLQLAYVFRLMTNIYSFSFLSGEEQLESATELFRKLDEVMTIIDDRLSEK